ncbi:hypothetical protein [Noviherbaspirillum sedimenti]|uniref:Uncharacterized protein n=1 Tax=Noviherbaspirillum sedimenti TaxID=2320865 RepID=A0A3A3G3U8_9BURK|nr:hypothetical protein [Noviherbaspirillum sedimenti]RJG02524.1 hypothetical protein D3878_13850 [Noviherbaspirillum sedimenti]
MRPNVQATDAASGAAFQPLAPLLQSTPTDKVDAFRQRLVNLDRDKLIDLFGRAIASGKRVAAFLIADELTARGIPPAFRHLHAAETSYSLDQRFDLLLADLRWLRRWYPEHVKSIRYMRYRELFAFSESAFHRAAEYVFYEGRRPAWKIVASMSLTERQQWDCAWLRSAPIKKHDATTQAAHEQVFSALRDDLHSVRRTKKFTEEAAHTTLVRRHALWLCSRMAGGSPAETAIRYTQLTGIEITRDIAARQLQKVNETLIEKRLTMSKKK